MHNFVKPKIPSSLVCLALLATAQLSIAAQTVGFPQDNPLITFDAPSDWKVKWKNDSLFVVSPDGGGVIVEVMPMEAAIDDEDAAIAEAKKTVDQDFKNLTLEKSGTTETNGILASLIGGEGEDKSGAAHINMVLIKHPRSPNQILFSLIASKDTASDYNEACGAMMNSLGAVSSEEPSSGESTQTFSYPNAKKPDFTVDFPADWKMKETDEGTYVESPDQLVAVNVILVDVGEVGNAEDVLKKQIGERFKEIVWNQGKDPEINKDEALGLTATFQNAVASDGEGTEKYSINLLSYVRKSGDKALIFLCQNPLRALDKHADTMTDIVKSIKVR